jgi:hypothetical protein
MECEADVTFFRLDGQNFFGRSMLGRWAESPEPVGPTMVGTLGAQPVTLYNPNLWNIMSWELRRMNIRAGDARLLDVAAHFDNDQESYGWTNANYFSQPTWRNPEWRLPAGCYLVRVRVISDAANASKIFRLINDAGPASFRLEPPMRTDPIV